MAILIERKLRRRRRKWQPESTLLHNKQEQEENFIINSMEFEENFTQRRADKVRGAGDISWPTLPAVKCAIPRGGQSLSLLLFIFAALLAAAPSNLNLFVQANNLLSNQQQQQLSQHNGYHQLQQGASPSVIMTNPPPSTPQSQKPRYKTMYACEDRQLSMDCDYGYKINLIRANFGRFSIATCNEQGQLDLSTDCKSPITFRIMSERCQDKQKCSINATSAIFGDRCPKTRKYLEVHFQCQLDTASSGAASNGQIEMVNLKNLTTQQAPIYAPSYNPHPSAYGPVLPPNNPPSTSTTIQIPSAPPVAVRPSNQLYQEEAANPLDQPLSPIQKPQQPSLLQKPITVMNSEMLNYNVNAENTKTFTTDQIVVTFRHTQTENMSNPRCVLWDPTVNQWTDKGSRIMETNLTHTTCAFEQASHYLLVMDYLAPYTTISQANLTYYPSNTPRPSISLPSYGSNDGVSEPNFWDIKPVPIEPNPSRSRNSQPSSSKFVSLFWYLLAFVFIVVAFMTIVFIATTMRSSAGAALKSLGNFTAFRGPNYKGRRADGTLHNKDLLVINNQNGHQFLYTPANTTKISSSSSTHILPGTLGHAGTLHHVQQGQIYSGNGTLSNLSGTGAQSNNYYYGLMGLNNLFQQSQQQQQQQQHQSQLQHHLNQQMNQTLPTSYLHQANKSTISNESANSSPSSSGVESGSTSVHHQQQQQTQQQQSCMVLNNDYNLMGHLSNFDQNPLNRSQQQATLMLNAHYSSFGATPMNMIQAKQQQQRFNLNQQNQSNMNREHIYECVDDDKAFSGRLLMPKQFISTTLSQHGKQHQHQEGKVGFNFP